MTFLTVKNLAKIYDENGDRIVALEQVSFALEKGESMAICGSSGAGKSTLLNILGGLDRASAGTVILDGQNLQSLGVKLEAKFRQDHLGFIFQFHHLLNDFNVVENVMLPLQIQGHDKKSACDEAMTWLDKVGLTDKSKRLPRELSGGEQQRVAIARALIHKPKLVLADEPTGNLDNANGLKVFELLCRLNHDLQATLIVVTHNEEYAKKLKFCLRLKDGRVASFA
jgi:lipoprotein-releasing system ATP-binding protein